MMVERNQGATAGAGTGGQSLGYTGYRCPGDSTVEGSNRPWVRAWSVGSGCR